jgi:hypothetical protein
MKALKNVVEFGCEMKDNRNIPGLEIFTDCKTLVQAIKQEWWGNLPSWRAAEAVAHIIR